METWSAREDLQDEQIQGPLEGIRFRHAQTAIYTDVLVTCQSVDSTSGWADSWRIDPADPAIAPCVWAPSRSCSRWQSSKRRSGRSVTRRFASTFTQAWIQHPGLKI